MRMLIAGGGTGGHVFPGVAIAEEFLARDPCNEVLFVGTRRGLEFQVLARLGYQLRTILVRPLAEMGMLRALLGCVALPIAVVQSLWVMIVFRPQVVVGVGGYASGPAVAAAWLLRLPTMIVEVNFAPGLTSRILGRFVWAVVTAFAGTAGAFPPGKSLHLGSPLRRQMLEGNEPGGPGRDGCRFTIFVFGGSQGAHAINVAMMGALPHLTRLREQIRIVHQTGQREVELVRLAYAVQGLQAEVHAFIDDMARHYREADLVVSRAGAMAVAELTALGKAAILIPYPYAAGGHQVRNAMALQEAGAAEVLLQHELTGEALADRIAFYVADSARLRAMAERSKELGRPDAARRCVDLAYDVAMRQRMEFRAHAVGP